MELVTSAVIEASLPRTRKRRRPERFVEVMEALSESANDAYRDVVHELPGLYGLLQRGDARRRARTLAYRLAAGAAEKALEGHRRSESHSVGLWLDAEPTSTARMAGRRPRPRTVH